MYVYMRSKGLLLLVVFVLAFNLPIFPLSCYLDLYDRYGSKGKKAADSLQGVEA